MKGLHVCLFLLLLVPSIPHPLAKHLEEVLDEDEIRVSRNRLRPTVLNAV